MIRHTKILFVILLMSSVHDYNMLLDSDLDVPALEKKIKSIEKKRSIAGTSSKLIEFSYKQKNIKELLDEFIQEHQLNINILYPETETITATVTFDAGRKVTITEAWDFITMICEQAGYTLVLRGNGNYTLITNTKAFNEPLPLYISVDYTQLPDSAERIRFIYYFNNIQLKKQQTELQTILNNMLPALATPADAAKQLVFDQNTNSMILTTKADMVKTVMQLVTILDESGFQEAVEVLPLDYARASEVVSVLKNVIGDAAKQTAVSLSAAPRARYFSEHVRVENLEPKDAKSFPKLNSIVIMGKVQDVEEIKKFIKKYLDVPLESGKSFYHVVELQWLNATKFKDVLRTLVKGGDSGGTGQSTSSLPTDLGFDPQIQIECETIQQGDKSINSNAPVPVVPNGSSALANTIQRGGNKLVIACASRDWERIEPLIKQLDIPQKQVIIEAVVMDLGITFARNLGAQIRTRGLVPTIFPKDMQAQAGMIINNIIASNYNQYNPNTPSPNSFSLVGDLSDILNPAGIASVTQPPVPDSQLAIPQTLGGATSGTAEAALVPKGSTIFMINGGKERTNGVWAFFQLLASHSSAKVFTRPVIMAINNQPATVLSNITKNLPDTVSNGTTPTVNYKLIQAPISIQFTPLISENDTVSLQIQTSLTTWVQPTNVSDGTKRKRILNTNVSMKSGDVLILGGLIKEDTEVFKNSVPFLEWIPIFGNFFSNRTKNSEAQQLYVLIRPTVVYPRTQGGMGPITKSASNFMVDQLADAEEAFGNLKDPITRWFFYSDKDQSAAEFFEEKIEELPTVDLGQSSAGEPRNITARKTEKEGGDMKVGWFSDIPSNSKFASKGAVDKRVENLQQFLKDIENPFEMGLQSKEQQRLQV